MARVIADYIDGEARLAEDGASARRVFLVHELSAAAAGRLLEAATAGGVPRVGDAHPARSDIRVLDVTARAQAGEPGMALVDVNYGRPTGSGANAGRGGIEISLQSDLITEETIDDVSGQRIQTTHTFVFQSQTSTQNITTARTHRVEVQRPTFSLVFQRDESAPPVRLARQFAGTVNSSLFQGDGADRWLCNIESSQDGVGRHLVRYRFTYNPDGWQARVQHVDDNGLIPADLRANFGVKTFQVYRRMDFNRLGLPAV